MKSPLLVALLVLGAGAPPPAVAVQRAATEAVTIPFELASRHIIVKVSVNKSRPLSFVLDTGANLAIVRMNVARELGLTLEGSVTAGGAGGGTQTGSRVRNATWSLAGLERVTQPVTLALPLPDLPAALGRDLDGIIGGEFIKQFVVELDYQARVMRLHDPAAFVYHGRGETLPIEINPNGHPVVQATVTLPDGTRLERPFLLDIGSGLAVAFHSPFVIEQDLLHAQSKTIRAIGAAGAGGRSVGRVGRVPALQLGSFTIANPIALFSEDKAGAFANRAQAGNIGAQIVRRFRTFLDYGRRRIILEPSAEFDEPFDRAFSGVALRAEGSDYRTFRIREVLEESPATDAGLAEGDIISAIDGMPAATLTLAAINELFEKPVKYELTIRRGDQTLTVALTPRRLI